MVVSGQPGVGKTALLGTLAKEGHGLFVVSAGIGKIADALRELRPDRVFVDDAHLDSTGPRDSLLGTLNRLRLEPAMSFRIVATTWPGHEDDIRHRLFLPSERVLRVNALERAVMAEIIRSVNPQFTDVLVGEILDQSDGRPGLAVTLAQWAQGGALEDLVNGQLLLTELRTDVRLSDATLDALATFALGGQRGMTLAAAARVMEMSETHLREAVLPVSGTGVIHETVNDLVPTRAVSVKPAALRHALVQRTYFSGALGKSLKRAVDEVEDAVACTETLIAVLGRGRARTARHHPRAASGTRPGRCREATLGRLCVDGRAGRRLDPWPSPREVRTGCQGRAQVHAGSRLGPTDFGCGSAPGGPRFALRADKALGASRPTRH